MLKNKEKTNENVIKAKHFTEKQMCKDKFYFFNSKSKNTKRLLVAASQTWIFTCLSSFNIIFNCICLFWLLTQTLNFRRKKLIWALATSDEHVIMLNWQMNQ